MKQPRNADNITSDIGTQVNSEAVATVQGSVAAVLDNISGESRGDDIPKSIFITLPIGLGLPEKLKAKIVASEYVDFGSLITNYSKANTSYSLSLSDAKGNQGNAALTLEPNVKIKNIGNIETWTTAFQEYVAIFTAQHPKEAPALMKNGEIIRDLAYRGFNWRYYDENFRFLRQSNPKGFPWSSTHSKLWIRSQPQTGRKYGNKTIGSSQEKPKSIPRGYCFTYHRGRYCAGCSFKHTCPSCQGNHQLTKCNFRGSRDHSAEATSAFNTNKGK